MPKISIASGKNQSLLPKFQSLVINLDRYSLNINGYFGTND